jgi:cytochrome c oxidase assembly protein Cox11
VQHFVKFHFRSTVFRSFKHEQNTRESAAWAERQKKLRSTVYYVVATAVLTVGLSYAAVPLYRMFCQVYFILVKLQIKEL